MTEQNTGNDSEDRKNGERSPRKFWPTLIEAIASYAAYNRTKAQQPNDPYSGNIAKWTKVTGIGTVVAAILAGAAAFVFWLQLETMRDSEQRQLRAYIIVEKITASGISDGACPLGENLRLCGYPYVVTTIRNAGFTPAY